MQIYDNMKLFMHELDLEEKRKAEKKLALQNNAAGVIQGRWKEKRARNNKKRKRRKRKESKLLSCLTQVHFPGYACNAVK